MKRLIQIVACWLFVSVAHAFAPEAGLWVVDAENNGQAGRGFQVDVQASTLVLTFYGYNGDGSAQWYLAAGPLNNNSFSGSLEKYAGGAAFGASQVAAHGTGSAGTVSMHFNDATHGTITLPGESPKAISRFSFDRPAAANSLNGYYRLERGVVNMKSNGAVYDSQANMTASGTMQINGSSVSQSVNVTINGVPGSATLSGSFVDLGAYIRVTIGSGASGDFHLITRGDMLITFNANSSGTEVDYWRRTSADPAVAKAHEESLAGSDQPGGVLLEALSALR
jgi:hypothetical protein